MQSQIQFSLSFSGSSADKGIVDLYDISQAILGFQRSLALTTHLVLNGEIITQTPSLKGARILATLPEHGSWKIPAIVLVGGAALYNLGTAPKDTPIGHMVYSLYDYVVSESLGVHVDYDKTLGELYEEVQKKNPEIEPVTESQADSLIEKCSSAIREMHRPIYKTETANTAQILVNFGGRSIPTRSSLSIETYEFINETKESASLEKIEGRVSSYNSNTYKGRIFVPALGRPVAFELNPKSRDSKTIQSITASLHFNAIKQYSTQGAQLTMQVFRRTSKTGHLKSFLVAAVG
jgi:hypothetical protein